MSTEKKNCMQEKKPFVSPRMIAFDRRTAAQSVCGWYTQCGKQVKSRS